MGVPAFYRWLSEKYPKIVTAVLEKRNNVFEGVEIPTNLLEENPNGVEYDNLYVDMNGLIHPCSHPEDRDTPSTESEMYVNVTKYVDRLFAAVRPRRVLFLAIDGVAPRAKMNQQRSRRFRAVKDAKERQKVMDEVMQDMKDLGLQAPEGHGAEWDSNVITPGTEFMNNLSLYMRFYVLDRMNKNPAWRNIKVILSDASEPGEGEHKIMSFVRAQRAKPGYDPNQRHILHGLDADLIMLALATHEAHFTILRELVSFGGNKNTEVPERSEGQKLLDAQSNRNMAAASAINPHDEWVYGKPLQALNIAVLRDYLANEFKCMQTSLPFPYDFERIVDDFVFLCFFVGNDFLPHLPSLDIRDGAIDFLIESYKDMLPSLGNYLTSPGGVVNLQQADVILGRVGEVEDEVFRRKKGSEEAEERKRAGYHRGPRTSGPGGVILAPRDRQRAEAESMMKMVQDGLVENHHPPRPTGLRGEQQTNPLSSSSGASGNKEAASRLKDSILGKRKPSHTDSISAADTDMKAHEGDTLSVEQSVEVTTGGIPEVDKENLTALRFDEVGSDEMEEEKVFEEEHKVPVPLTEEEAAKAKADIKKRIKAKEFEMIDGYKTNMKDAVCLHETGWKSRYYEDPFKKENLEHGGGLKRMCVSYVEGLCWVMKYYYQGVPSWNWYYPFHYAPFASDLLNIDTYTIAFEQSEPFRPVEQLLAVLPAESVAALPIACRPLMVDPASPIIDLYGSDAPIDPNGKHLPWLWILLLPFVDEKRIVSAFQQCKSAMTVEECRRNAFGVSVIFLHSQHKIAVEARSKMRYRPMAETDADVLAVLSKENAEHMELYENDNEDEDNNASAVTDGGGEAAATMKASTSSEESIIFDHELGSGISGTISAPPQKWFTLTGANNNVVAPPTPHPCAFHDLIGNQVMCLTYASPVEEPGSHKSEQLPGVVADKCVLTSFDLMPRKPPRLNKGGFNIVELALKVKKGFNPNNIISYNNNVNGNGNGNDRGYNNNNHQRQFNQGSNPQQFLQHFQQQQQQYSNNNNGHQQGYGNDIAQRSYGQRGNDRDNRFNSGGDGRDRQHGGNDRYNDNNRQYSHSQNRNNQPYSDNSRSYGQQGQGPGPPGYMPPHQQYASHGYQQHQQQHNGHYQTAQGYPQQSSHNNGNARHSFSTQPPMPSGSGNGFAPTSMDSMRAQLAQTLQQQQQQGGGHGPPPGPGPFASVGSRKDFNQGPRESWRRGAQD